MLRVFDFFMSKRYQILLIPPCKIDAFNFLLVSYITSIATSPSLSKTTHSVCIMAADNNGGVGDDGLYETAVAEFSRPEFKLPTTHNLPLGPVYLRNFGLRKKDGSTTGQGNNSLKTAPNFASAILGRWLAEKLGLSNSPKVQPDADYDEGTNTFASSTSHVFQSINAILHPGEGTLLLGPSSSGKTTFMRTLSDILSGTPSTNAEGSVLLGPTRWDPTTCNSNLKRTVAFCDQSDLTLTPILTVEETVEFARSCAENIDEKVLEESMDAIFKLAGLDHVTKTVVGNADVRGVSGGT